MIRQYKGGNQKLADYCDKVGVSTGAFRKWMQQYEEQGLDGLARSDSEIGSVLPEGVDPTEEAYKREILKLRIENERLKKTMQFGRTKLGNRNMFV